MRSRKFSPLSKSSPAFRSIFFGDGAAAESPKKDATAIGAKTSFFFSYHRNKSVSPPDKLVNGYFIK